MNEKTKQIFYSCVFVFIVILTICFGGYVLISQSGISIDITNINLEGIFIVLLPIIFFGIIFYTMSKNQESYPEEK